MSLRCYIVDDESHAIGLLRLFIAKTPGLECCGSSTDAPGALEEIRAERPDITFADINMPDLSGLQLAGLIATYTTVVFTTSFREYAPEAFESAAADYLLKPIGYERFLKCIARLQPGPQVPAGSLLVTTGEKGVLSRVNFSDIHFISGLAPYATIHLGDKKIVTYLSLAALLERLPAGRFLQIHNSTIVNADFILGVENKQVLLPGHTRLTVSRSHWERFRDTFIRERLLVRGK